MNSTLMFSKQSDLWETPQEFFDRLHAEFQFTADVAATAATAKVGQYIGPGALFTDALDDRLHWGNAGAVFCNPPYSRCAEFVAKAASETRHGCTTVMLIPSRTDTRWWHAHIWDAETHQPRPGVEIRFVKGRLKFGDGKNSAPFPSVVIVFRPVAELSEA